MLVGMVNITKADIESAHDVQGLKDMALRMVPKMFQHRKEIVDNQKYLIALKIRSLYGYDYNKWAPLCEGLLEGVRVTGSIHDLYTCQDLLYECDTDMIDKFLEKEGRIHASGETVCGTVH